MALGTLAGASLVAVAAGTGIPLASLTGFSTASGRAVSVDRLDPAEDRDIARRATGTATKPRSWPRCPECGVIESVRPMAESGRVMDRADAVERARARAALAGPEGAFADRGPMEGGYEVIVRFKDGTTATFDAAAQRNWRVGRPVHVIVGGHTPTP